MRASVTDDQGPDGRAYGGYPRAMSRPGPTTTLREASADSHPPTGAATASISVPA